MNGDDRRHNKDGRRTDADYANEVRLLRSELTLVRDKSRARENDLVDRVRKLQEQLDELKRKFAGARGVLYGFGLGFSTLIYLVVDRLKELFIK